jgi:hypothetical protein
MGGNEMTTATQAQDRTYNGWSTYETWMVNLWIDGHVYLREEVVNAETLFDAKEILQSWIDNEYDLFLEAANQTHGGLFPDLLKGALRNVNWYEIAKNWRDEE